MPCRVIWVHLGLGCVAALLTLAKTPRLHQNVMRYMATWGLSSAITLYNSIHLTEMEPNPPKMACLPKWQNNILKNGYICNLLTLCKVFVKVQPHIYL